MGEPSGHVEGLCRLLTAPAHPFGAVKGMSASAKNLDRLPADYLELVARFGSGCIDEFLWLLSPFSTNPHLNVFVQERQLGDALHRLRYEFGVETPFLAGISAGRLIPWAVSDNGDVVYWHLGSHDSAAVVVQDSDCADWQEFQCSCSEFLMNVLTGLVEVRAFPAEFPPYRHTFRPADRTSD